MAQLLRRQAPQLTVSLAFIHACAVQRFLQTWYSAALLIEPVCLLNDIRVRENKRIAVIMAYALDLSTKNVYPVFGYDVSYFRYLEQMIPVNSGSIISVLEQYGRLPGKRKLL